MVPMDMNNNGDNNNNEKNNNNFWDAEFENENTNENQEEESLGNNQEIVPNKIKRYHRHTQHQIQEMEAFFEVCPHPNDKKRKELSGRLGLDHLQIKFWFQNKRTQNKNQLERHENLQLRTENNKLRADNHYYREIIAKSLCPKCGDRNAISDMSYEEHQLRLENAHLQEEINQLSVLAQKYTDKPVMTYPIMSHPVSPRPLELGVGTIGRDEYENRGNLWRSFTGPLDANKELIIELAVEAMRELMMMAQVGEPLWKGGVNGTSLTLNLDEYTRTFRKGLGSKPYGFRTEASRQTAVVVMNHMNIVESLMDVDKWSNMFAGMIARAMAYEVFTTEGTKNFNGTFHLMLAEYQVLSPLVSTRESYFVRYCKQQGGGLWVVVDVSIDHLVPNLKLKCRRRPSGCLIQEIPNGLSKVTWVEHVEVDDRGGIHNMYTHLVTTGQALGASRWVSTLDRHCERLASIMTPNFPFIEQIDLIRITNQGKRGLLKLAERMARSFFAGVTTSTANMWYTVNGYVGENVRVMARNNINDPGRPPGVALCAATSFWVPVSPKTVFDFLRDDNNRTNWDVLSNGETVKKSQIVNGRDSRNCVSLLHSANTNLGEMMMIQETSTDPTSSFLIYAPVDVTAIEIVLNGGDPNYVALLPSGFAIFPDGKTHSGEEGGSLLNIAFQILVESVPTGKLNSSSIATIENLILATTQNIKAFFHSQTASTIPFGE